MFHFSHRDFFLRTNVCALVSAQLIKISLLIHLHVSIRCLLKSQIVSGVSIFTSESLSSNIGLKLHHVAQFPAGINFKPQKSFCPHFLLEFLVFVT